MFLFIDFITLLINLCYVVWDFYFVLYWHKPEMLMWWQQGQKPIRYLGIAQREKKDWTGQSTFSGIKTNLDNKYIKISEKCITFFAVLVVILLHLTKKLYCRSLTKVTFYTISLSMHFDFWMTWWRPHGDTVFSG